MELLNKAGYHAVTIGNNEGMTFPHEDLNHLYDDRQFEVLILIYITIMENALSGQKQIGLMKRKMELKWLLQE